MVVNSSNIKMEAVSTVALCEVKKSRAEYMKEYREKNRDKIRENANKYYNNKKDDEDYKNYNKERVREYRNKIRQKLEKLKELETIN
jgi:hypothetical protein